jgi:Response regulator containing a CheY-like receiver domain and an HTH DNA-binding domain
MSLNKSISEVLPNSLPTSKASVYSFNHQTINGQINIIIVDDHALIRENWAYILNMDTRFSVIAQCGSGEEAVELCRSLRPHIVLMDINLPGINGIEASKQIRKFAPATKVIGVSLHSQPSYARKMIQNGASGYVTKNSSREELSNAIVNIHFGKKYICEEIKNILAENVISDNNNSSKINCLSSREIEIISQIKKGNSSKEIADILKISVKTVEVHRYNILRKLNLKNSAALVNYIHNSGIELQ